MVIKMLITFIQLNQKLMQTAPQILLSTRLYKKQPVDFIGFKFRWDLAERMKKIFNDTYSTENNCKNFKNLFDDMDN